MPGMGRGARQRFWRNMAIAVLVGLLASGTLGFLIWILDR